MIAYKKILPLHPLLRSPRVGKWKRDIMIGVYLTLYSQLTKTSHIFKDSEDIATVDACGIFLWTALAVL